MKGIRKSCIFYTPLNAEILVLDRPLVSFRYLIVAYERLNRADFHIIKALLIPNRSMFYVLRLRRFEKIDDISSYMYRAFNFR